jgi:hypothetical protein
VKTQGLGCLVAGVFLLILGTWISCEQFQERQCREKEWRWDGERCAEP